ncbi:1215_t:CDS:10 [Gigaspora margarita]|uniref:1215_t:CDS:1 n=1 Tax=Gigaspora margarita TaxID=4874 RepID=A0ABN7UQW9_GIGMA|nr:1215_t:CDS:10 [Gigaspora margarita]
MYNDNPVIQHSLAEETSIPAPATNISCHFVNVSDTHDCKQYITLLNVNNTDYGVQYTSFFMMEDLKFSKIPNNGISSLEFKLYLNDTSYNLSNNWTLPIVIFSLDDADFMKSYDRNLILSTQLSTYSKLLETILRLNQYNPAAFNVNIYKIYLTLENNNEPDIEQFISDSNYQLNSPQNESTQFDSYKVKIKRRRKELMLPSWENFLGLSSKFQSIPYLTSTLETFPLLNGTSEFPTLTLLMKITVEPQSFIVHVETDKRVKTVINSLGLIGGATAIYAVLFGTKAIKPWGLVQKYGFKINNSVQTKLRNTYEIIPLVHHSTTTNNLKKHELRKRLDSLQLFLTENVYLILSNILIM